MKKYISSITILAVFVIFAVVRYITRDYSPVLEVVRPNMIIVDFNKNGSADENETVCLPEIESFYLDLDAKSPTELPDVSQRDIVSLGYLAQEFSKNVLYQKSVKVEFTDEQNQDCRFGEIFVDGEKYSDTLMLTGLAFKHGEYNKDNYEKQLENARKLDLVILNHKSYKYHELDCEYGRQSHDYVIIPEKQLPKEAKPCKYCHVERKSNMPKDLAEKIIPQKARVVSSGNIKLILPDFTTKLVPDKNCDNEVCKSLLTEINNSKSSIDMAIYGWDHIPKIYDAIQRAKSRGVRFRLVYDAVSANKKNIYPDTSELVDMADESKSDFSPSSTADTDKLMHNKFIIFDNKTVFTGSMNLSYTGLSGYNANTVWVINSPDIADLYKREFEQMLAGKFHNSKQKVRMNRNFILGSSEIAVYFSPYDRATEYILPLLDGAKNYIYMPTFLITHKNMAEALVRAKQRGVDVRIIIDANNTNTRNSKHDILRKNGILLKTENFAGKMHSKSIIIDDEYVVAGSMNFSNSGENKNDENLVIVKDSKLAKTYKEFFSYMWNKIPDKWLTKNARAESKDSIGSCYDGIDNNFDGKVDMNDEACMK